MNVNDISRIKTRMLRHMLLMIFSFSENQLRIMFSPFTHDYMGYAVLQVLPRAFRDDHPPLCSLSEEAKVH